MSVAPTRKSIHQKARRRPTSLPLCTHISTFLATEGRAVGAPISALAPGDHPCAALTLAAARLPALAPRLPRLSRQSCCLSAGWRDTRAGLAFMTGGGGRRH